MASERRSRGLDAGNLLEPRQRTAHVQRRGHQQHLARAARSQDRLGHLQPPEPPCIAVREDEIAGFPAAVRSQLLSFFAVSIDLEPC